jgi:hypothetical protein
MREKPVVVTFEEDTGVREKYLVYASDNKNTCIGTTN